VENDNKNIGFRANNEEVALIDQEAARIGMNRADYLRFRTIPANGKKQETSDTTGTSIDNLEARLEKLEALVKHGIYITNQVYVALYAIAEDEGKAGRFLTAPQLDEVHDRVRAEALDYAVKFPASFAAVQAEIAAMNEKAKA